MSHWITLVTPHGRMNGWLAEPDDKPNGGVVIVHDVFGINDGMKVLAARYAQAGYLTLVPALFDKVQREVELDCTEENFDLGTSIAARLGLDTATELAATAVDAIGHAGKVALVGHGWGASVALRSATALALPWIDHYGTLDPAALGAQTSIPAMLHYGTGDTAFSPQLLRGYGDTLPLLQSHGYAAGPAFSREGDPTHFDALSAEHAYENDLDFLRMHVRHENG